MRLTHIKLAGFKSFVDPTNIPIPGQLVGVVGPNGCGKSNVIDAVRWVLGESQARQLRGETMQDVIFAGSGGRKPVNRASVELIFDNSLGKAAGQWSQYAEIAVKRVLQRNGDSTYSINNLHVRRRDVTDIFMGTGLGARAYAIIEQGMISRIIEARPEELRIFLEEAAGISRYKERRRETEQRLNATRENLLRVDDIRTELLGQLQRLEVQARVAQEYQALQQQLETAQNLLLLLRKFEAGTQRLRFEQEVQRLINELEAETAGLRGIEASLEQMRAEHYAAGDLLHGAQGELYGANAEVARLEQQLQHLGDSRRRMESQLAAVQSQQAQVSKQNEAASTSRAHWQAELDKARLNLEQGRATAELERQRLPLAEEAYRDSQRRVAELQRNLAEAQQARQIEETHRTHAAKTLQQLQSRRERLLQEQGTLPRADEQALAQGQVDLEVAQAEAQQLQESVALLQNHLSAAEQNKIEAGTVLQAAHQRLAQVQAQLQALRQLQRRLGSDDKLKAWLAGHGLDQLGRVWQDVQVEPGWETALESVLGERLNAICVDDLERAHSWLGEAVPGKVVLLEAAAEGVLPADVASSLVPLSRYVSKMPVFMADWLPHVYVAPDAKQALVLRHELPAGALLVCPEGHIFTRHSANFHAPHGDMDGVLARQQEIAHLEKELEVQEAFLTQQKTSLAEAEQAFRECQAQLSQQRDQFAATQQRQHRLQLEVVKLTQTAERVAQRSQQIGQELAEIAGQVESETEQQESNSASLAEFRRQADTLQEHLEDARQERGAAEQAVNRQRQVVQAAERGLQEAGFYEKTCANKIQELGEAIRTLSDSLAELKLKLDELQFEQSGLDEAPLQQALQQALGARQVKEQALAVVRDSLEGITHTLKESEQARMKSEQKLQPLRDRLEQARLKEQEARLNEAQFSEQLEAAGANETDLATSLERGAKAGVFQSEITRLTEAIEVLGAVNLAALQELQSAQERTQYLNAQADDLNQAIDTLESAIRRIDKDTRERLQDTFDTVNRSMSEMFPSLFGGGQAYLVLTGEEILDAGVQVVAQPPGKKNSSIHLLSGGEKALTALSLVFSLFKLNPAPFCLLDEVDAPLDDTNTGRFCELVKKMSQETQFLFISHNKITMEMAQHLVGITMQESGVSRVVAVDIEEAMRLTETAAV